MTRLMGAAEIAAKLSELAGLEVSRWQVYRLANQRAVPIDRDRERWKISASSDGLAVWWAESRLARNLANRLKAEALGNESARMHASATRRVFAQAGDAGEVQIVGVIGEGNLQTDTFNNLLKALGEVDRIRAIVNSQGGHVAEGLAIYHALRSHKAKVEIEIVGVAASMASAIAMAGDHISMAEDGLFMLHDPWVIAGGNADELRAAADMLDKHGDSLAGIYARRTQHTESEILEMMGKDGGGGSWLNAEEALEAGFIDEILAPAKARLPNVPAAALAKRISKPRRGDPQMNKFLAKLAALLKAKIKGDNSREDAINELATQAEISADAVAEILDGKKNPTLPQLRAFADVLGVATKDLRTLAEEEGVKFDNPSARPTPDPTPSPQPSGAVADVQAAVAAALRADQARQRGIRAEAARFGIPEDATQRIVDEAADLADGRHRILDYVADPQNQPQLRITGTNGTITGGTDDRDKWLDGMSQWLVIKSGNRGLVEANAKKRGQSITLDPGEYRGYTLIDIARDCLENEGINCRRMNSNEIAGRLLRMVKASVMNGPGGLGTTSDFPLLLENALHKMLLAAYMTSPDKWRSIAATGTVNDFRPHPRLRLGSLSRLDALLESGEFKYKHFPDAEKEVIQAATQGNIIGLTRQSIVNDDVDGFSRMVVMLGRAAGLSIELDVFALFALNSGAGPTMQDGNPLFHSSHANIAATAGTTTQALLDESRILMAQQTDPAGNEILDLRPDVWVGPIAQGAATRSAVTAEFDFDAAQSGGSSKFMKPNTVRDLVSTIVDTPRLSGTRWYLLADPAVAPVIEVVFLQGQESPVIETMEGFDFDGVKWRVKHDFGVGATDHRGATTNPGS